METTYLDAQELMQSLWSVSEKLNAHHKEMMKKITKAVDDLRTNNYVKINDDNENHYHGLWSTDGKGEPCINSDDIPGWTECNSLLKKFEDEYRLGCIGPQQLPSGSIGRE